MTQTTPKLASSETSRNARGSYAGRMTRVVDFIERNLDDNLSLERLSDVAHFSPFHFHRQFRSFTGITVARLIRLMRLRRASLQLAFDTRTSVTEIALVACFENAESFSRAFRALQGQTPSAFRKNPVWQDWQVRPLINQERFNQEKMDMNIDVEFVDFPTTNVAAVEYQGPESGSLSATMKLVAWRRENGIGPERGATYGIHYTDPASTPPQLYRMDICVSYDGEIEENHHGVVAKTIPGGRCARLRHCGSRDYIAEADFLYRTWLPTSGEELRDYPIFFHYVNVGPDVQPPDMITDVYLPLR